MTNNIEIFDSKHYGGRGETWSKMDTVTVTTMAAVPLFFVFMALAMILPAAAWALYPVISVGIGQTMRKGIQGHRFYGLTDTQIEAIEAIETLPPEIRARYGDDYVEHVRKIGTGNNASNLYYEVQNLAEQQRITELNRREHELAPVVDAMRTATKEIAVDLKLLDPGPLQLTTGKSSPEKPEHRSRPSLDEIINKRKTHDGDYIEARVVDF